MDLNPSEETPGRVARRGAGWMLHLAVAVVLGSMGAGAQSLPGSPPSPAQKGAAAAKSSTPSAATITSSPDAQAAAKAQAANEASSLSAAKVGLSAWKGLRVEKIEFEGVVFDAKDPLPQQIPQQAGEPLEPAKVAASIRQLFASGRYRDIRVEGEREGGGVTLVFAGTPQLFVGRVTIDGVKDERLTSLLEYATKLQPGTDFTDGAIAAGTDGVKQTLATNGYFQPTVTAKAQADDPDIQVNPTYMVNVGPQARIGAVAVAGTDTGFTATEFRLKAKLKKGKVTRDTVSNALTRIRSQYQKRDRLEATATLEKQTYNPQRKQVDYSFNANQGPLVKVVVEGAKLSKGRLKLLVPIYQEGTIDNDLLNEGTFNMQDFLFQQGYFDATVSVKVVGEGTASVSVVYAVVKGAKHKVGSVTIVGNRYFDTDLLKERMQVQKADAYLRNGRYSPALMKSDVDAIQALYRANGFNQATITTAVKDVDTTKSGSKLKVAELSVVVTISEGQQQKFGPVLLTGVESDRVKDVRALLSSQEGQPYSLITLSGDRDAILSYYLSKGFAQARVDVGQQLEGSGAARMDVTLNVTEGEQVFVDRVLTSGVVHTRPAVVDKWVKVFAGDPLDQSALLDTQRRLYDLALFNEVNVAMQNPDGDDPLKNVLLQLTEARRWDVTYGFGFEAETGKPQEGVINPASRILLGLPANAAYSQNGTTGVSPRVSLDVSRLDLRGTDESLTLHATYGLLEEVATLTFQIPHLLGSQKLTSSVEGGYSNVQNISTFQASTLQGDYRITQKVKKTDTFIYNFEFRRVAVNPATLQVSANLIPQLSQPVRVGGPGITWFHDKRDPSPLDASKGSYTSVDEFFSSSKFGSESSFNRVDVSNSTYYSFGKRRYVLARNTRMGFENPFGPNPNTGSTSCATNFMNSAGGLQDLLATNPSCNAVPLPERLYAGGATSHRGFPINGAGPRDLQTGYPVGGNAVFVNTTELRLPALTLPYLGDSLSFVAFHDMGNVFTNISDVFPSFTRFHQPNQQTCANVSSAFGACNFNYYSHAVGMGLRYKTPVGPIRADFSYNLNPPVYPVIYDFNGAAPYEGQASHFNFFFSIGQAF